MDHTKQNGKNFQVIKLPENDYFKEKVIYTNKEIFVFDAIPNDMQLTKLEFKSATYDFLDLVQMLVEATKKQNTIPTRKFTRHYNQLIRTIYYALYGQIMPEEDPKKNYILLDRQQLLQDLNLPYREITLKPVDYSPTMLGPKYWRFLHLLSIIAENDSFLTERLAVLLTHFDFYLYCGKCQVNYQAKQVLYNFSIPLLVYGKATSCIYNLHNVVNNATGKRTFPIDEFKQKYNLTIFNEEIKLLHRPVFF